MGAGKPTPSHPPQRRPTWGQVTGAPPPPEGKGRAPDSSRGQRGAGQGTAQNSVNDPKGPRFQRGRMCSTMGLGSPGVASDA
jgi:hypothetical protein